VVPKTQLENREDQLYINKYTAQIAVWRYTLKINMVTLGVVKPAFPLRRPSRPLPAARLEDAREFSQKKLAPRRLPQSIRTRKLLDNFVYLETSGPRQRRPRPKARKPGDWWCVLYLVRAAVAVLAGGSVLLVDVVGGGWVAGGALVGHFGVVAVLPVGGVADDLGAAVGKQDAVLSADDVSVGSGVVREVGAVVVVLDGVVEVVGHAGLVVVVLRKKNKIIVFLFN